MKYKINRDQPPLTDGEIASARNFNQVAKGYRTMKIPFYKSGKFITRGSAIIVAAAVALIVLFDDKSEKPREYISPPLAHVIIPTDTFVVDADSATDITYKSGSKLHIPAGAFRDLKGNPIKGKVNLNYREFHDQKDIFLSGIPMTYDSAGSTYVFESAGMMEISASQSGKPLATNTDKTITVDMVSNTKEDRYNTYYLNTTAKKWVNLNQANLVVKNLKENNSDTAISSEETSPIVAKCEQELTQTVAAVKAIEKEKPMPIAKADKDKTKFHIVVDAGEFPEIAMYKGVRFQVKDEKNFDPGSAKTEWENVKLKKLTEMDYEVTFSKGAQTLKVVATPVIDGQDLAAAQKIYDQKFAEYQTKLADKKTAEEKAKMEYQARVKEMGKIMADQRSRDSFYESHMSKTQLIYRTFSINFFGIHNCDNPAAWPSGADVIATMTDENGKKLQVSSLSLVEKNINAVFPYETVNGECHHFKFSPSGTNMIWAVTTDNKLAIVDAESFRAQQSKTGSVQFKFKVIDKDFKSSDEVKKYLEI